MSIEEYLDKMIKIQENLLTFLDDEENEEGNFQNLLQIFNDTKIQDDKNDFRLFLCFLAKISNNHHRTPNFFSKIEQILNLFKDEIKTYSNSTIFNIFKGNKRILLFLIEESIIILDKYVVKSITTDKYVKQNYPQYFAPEILPFMNEEWFPKYNENNLIINKNEWIKEIKKELPENFSELRKKGENDYLICKMIQGDLIEDFVAYVTHSNISVKSEIKESIYETNPFLINMQIEANKSRKNKGISLIEYAAFFGSIQIFNYLKIEDAEMTSSLWLYAIHGKNADLIHILEESNVDPYEGILKESIKCHHNNITEYILNNELDSSNTTSSQSVKYYNFEQIQKESIKNLFFDLCKYDYCSLVEILLTIEDIDVNQMSAIRQPII